MRRGAPRCWARSKLYGSLCGGRSEDVLVVADTAAVCDTVAGCGERSSVPSQVLRSVLCMVRTPDTPEVSPPAVGEVLPSSVRDNPPWGINCEVICLKP